MKKRGLIISIYILVVIVSLIVGLVSGTYASDIPSYVYGPTASDGELGRVHYYKGWFEINFSCETEVHYEYGAQTLGTRYYGTNILFVVILYVVLLIMPFVVNRFLINSNERKAVK